MEEKTHDDFITEIKQTKNFVDKIELLDQRIAGIGINPGDKADLMDEKIQSYAQYFFDESKVLGEYVYACKKTIQDLEVLLRENPAIATRNQYYNVILFGQIAINSIGLNQEMMEARSTIKNERVRYIEILGIFAAFFSLIAINATAFEGFELSEILIANFGFILMIIAVVAFSSYSLDLNRASKWWASLVVGVVCILGLVWMIALVDEREKNEVKKGYIHKGFEKERSQKYHN